MNAEHANDSEGRSETGARPAPPPDVPVPAAPSPGVPEQYILTIGDIGVTRSWVVTPNGTAPLAGSRWLVMDQTRTERKIPSWAIVLAVLLALLCLLGLLFLLVKEEQTVGYVEVTVMSGSLAHVTQIPATSAWAATQVRQQVYQAQSLAAAAGG